MSNQKKEKKTVKKEKKSASKYQNLRINHLKKKQYGQFTFSTY